MLELYGGVVAEWTKAKYLRRMAAKLRDSLKSRFGGIFEHLKMAYSATPEREPFNNKVYLVAAVLDPNLKLFWVEDIKTDDEVEDETEAKHVIKQKLEGKCPMVMSLAFIIIDILIWGQNANDKAPTPNTPIQKNALSNPKTRNTKVSGISYIDVLSAAL